MDNGYTTAPSSSITYSSVCFREIVRIVCLLAYLNDLEIFACDTGNAYLNTKFREKLWTETGTEFGSEKWAVIIIARSLYGLKNFGGVWRTKLAETLKPHG